jgi:hypothetical protein
VHAQEQYYAHVHKLAVLCSRSCSCLACSLFRQCHISWSFLSYCTCANQCCSNAYARKTERTYRKLAVLCSRSCSCLACSLFRQCHISWSFLSYCACANQCCSNAHARKTEHTYRKLAVLCSRSFSCLACRFCSDNYHYCPTAHAQSCSTAHVQEQFNAHAHKLAHLLQAGCTVLV